MMGNWGWNTFSVLAILVTSAALCSAESTTETLRAFDTILICAPLNVLVAPSSDGSHQIRIEADTASGASNIRVLVIGSELSIAHTGSIVAEHSLKVTVFLPATSLRALEVRSSSDVYLAPGFASQTLSLTTGQLGGSIAASQLTANQLSISAAGLAKVTVDGTFGEVKVDAAGASSVHIAGLEKKASLNLNGLVDVAIAANSADASIVGTSVGSRVLYNQGTCSMKGAAAGGALCAKDSGLKISAAPLRWLCKAAITGFNSCGVSGNSASTFASTGSDCPIMTFKGAKKATKEKPTSTRRLRETTISGSTSSTGSLPTSFAYTTTSTGADGEPTITSCSFINNKGGCQVNGTPVPVQQFGGDLGPAPAPAPEEDPLAAQAITQIAEAAAVSSRISTSGATSMGGTACAFVNGIGGCQTTG